MDILEGRAKDVQPIRVAISDKMTVDAAFSEAWPVLDESPVSVSNAARNIRFYKRHTSLIPLSFKVNFEGPENIIDVCQFSCISPSALFHCIARV